jgi:hypothetical protein
VRQPRTQGQKGLHSLSWSVATQTHLITNFFCDPSKPRISLEQELLIPLVVAGGDSFPFPGPGCSWSLPDFLVMSKANNSSSRPPSVASSTRSGTPSNRGRFFRPVPYSTSLALQQLLDGGSDTSHTTRPTPVNRSSGSSSRPRYANPSPASTRRDQVESEVGRGHNLPVVDEQGQVWMDWEERQEFAGLVNQRNDDSDWVGFAGTERDSDEESTKRTFDPPSRQLLEAFSFQTASTSTNRIADVISPDQPNARPRGKARIRRVKTSESLRAGSAPIVIPPVPSQHHTNQLDPDAVQEFVESSFDPPTFATPPDDQNTSRNSRRRSSMLLRGLARKFIGKK